MHEDKEQYSEFKVVEDSRNYLTAEEFPEGTYGMPIGENEPVQNKSTPWQKGQKRLSSYTYENRQLHDDLPRQMEGAHPLHDE